MDSTEDSQATQQATQTAFDPRRIGQQNSPFSDEELADIICLLHPVSENAKREVQRLVSLPEYAGYTRKIDSTDIIDSSLYYEDDASGIDPAQNIGGYALVLRLSSPLKNPRLGFTFGRNQARCDINFDFDPVRRLSNIHFGIYVNSYGSVLLEDQSMNGTVVNNKLLRKQGGPDVFNPRRTLDNGDPIKIVMHERRYDLNFIAGIPHRDGEHVDAYARNVDAYTQISKRGNDVDVDKTIGPGPSGHVNLFAPTKGGGLKGQSEADSGLQRTSTRLPREFRGNDKYARRDDIGKGAFATVYVVTSRFNGQPFAAKELDKRKFMKDNVLDQKVENEMKIMQKVKHPNIVEYKDHFEDPHKLIIVMEYLPLGDLGQYVRDSGAIVERHVKTIAEQLVDALGYLHENRITHRDVKPDNVLIASLSPPVVKLTDFGLSKIIDTEQTFLKTFCGTLLYCAPEVYTEFSSYDDNGRRTNRRNHRRLDRERYDHAVDIWSLGGVLFYTLTGSPPFPVVSRTSYTELLDHIVKTPLDTAPLTKFNVSANGIQFLTRMINVQPETRATIAELKAHDWLAHSGSPTDQDFDDDDLGHSASQLSLDDRRASEATIPLYEPESDYSMNFESGKENDPSGQPRPPKLFGEVSVIRRNDAIPAHGSDTSSGETERYGSEVRDSVEDSDNFSTPRDNVRRYEDTLSTLDDSLQQDNTRSALLGIGSQSLGGASSILENLNMKSVANANLGVTSSLATSKRKTNHGTSDEYDTISVNDKPSTKRLKSQMDVQSIDNSESEDILIASIPKMIKSHTGRQIDYPLPKTIYWDSRDESSRHLEYPEMTHLQYSAFEAAAERRNEEFGPGTTPLWELAMKYFPPTHGPRQEESSTGDSSDWDIPQTAPIDTFDDQIDSQLANSTFDKDVSPNLTTSLQPKIDVGVFKSTSDSLLTGISIPLQDPILSWGRGKNNTVIYEPTMETRVPKNAFRVVLWREGYTASDSEFRPWDLSRSTISRTMRASPEPDSYAFYIATKATLGIFVNANPLVPNEPKDVTTTASCKYWMRLYHGDEISFWGRGNEQHLEGKLTFECFWGGSSATRPPDEPPTCVPAPIAQKLDRLWPKAAKSLEYVQIKEKAQAEQEVRMRNMLREQERSRAFEKLRLEAIRRVEERASRRTSPADTERARSGPPVRRFSPPEHVQNGR
ncbi:Pkinase-domain-containing protein [Xylaria intraflava]|nr:Pkinase-domain-containing protein [Xylaria intraflava]